MEPSIFEYDPPAKKGILNLRDGPWAGKTWNVALSVCASPLCGCPNVEFECILADSGSGGPETTLRFWLDVEKQELFRGGDPVPSHKSLALGKAVAAELRETDWLTLTEYLVRGKRAMIDEADVTQLDADFPEEVMRGEGYMVGYGEIFPFAGGFPFQIESNGWLVDDQYCVNPACRCREALLSFIRLPEATTWRQDLAEDEAAARYDYKRGRFLEVYTHGAAEPALEILTSALKQAHPKLDLVAKKRHLQLKALYKQALARTAEEAGREADIDPPPSGAAPPPGPELQPKAGRNDPCPCGSGKKYKKCCGR